MNFNPKIFPEIYSSVDAWTYKETTIIHDLDRAKELKTDVEYPVRRILEVGEVARKVWVRGANGWYSDKKNQCENTKYVEMRYEGLKYKVEFETITKNGRYQWSWVSVDLLSSDTERIDELRRSLTEDQLKRNPRLQPCMFSKKVKYFYFINYF